MISDLALYVHWPFCLARCPYCDFNSHVRNEIDQPRFAAALRQELATEASRLGRRRLTSIFFGGGTPSLMFPETVAMLVDDAVRWFDPAQNLEITLEANPTSVEVKRLADYQKAGVNRVSIGIQSLNDAALRTLGRQHSAAEAIAALSIARRLFERVSFDLIYARPGQDLVAWRQELRSAFGIVSEHLSLYQLTIEPATQYAVEHRQGKIALPDSETAAALYDTTLEECARVGLLGYEISNYAQPGAESRHNLTYWRYLDYAGIGPGAHGRITLNGRLRATRRHRAPEIWADKVERTGDGLTRDASVPAPERGREALLMGLRLTEGIDKARFRSRTGLAIETSIDSDMMRKCVNAGYLIDTSEHLVATYEGRLRLDSLLKVLVL